jgi:hypothetical protein
MVDKNVAEKIIRKSGLADYFFGQKWLIFFQKMDDKSAKNRKISAKKKISDSPYL